MIVTAELSRETDQAQNRRLLRSSDLLTFALGGHAVGVPVAVGTASFQLQCTESEQPGMTSSVWEERQ